ncbi:MAG TPA: alpha/beta hydrolase [Candidatus Lokiarchaeia archaeon]|nr:alpha/beta hydrolase [Candidatus Lokiarchaeia archaeon]
MGIIKIASGASITYEVYGEDDASLPTVFCVNGIFFNADQWNDVAPHVMKKIGKPIRVITYNGQGIGDSSMYDRAITVDDQIQEIVSVMDELNVQKCHVLAMSSGTYPAILLLRDFPERVESFCGYGTFSPFSKYLGDTINYFNSLEFAFYEVRHMVKERVSRTNYEDFFDLFASQLERKIAKKPLFQLLENTRIASIKIILDVVKQYQILPAMLGVIQKANLPMMFMYGEKDEIISPQAGWEVNENVPGSTLVTIPKETHFSPALNASSAKRVFDYYVDMLERWL